MYRFIEIYFSDFNQLRKIYNLENKFFSDILNYRIKIFYTLSDTFKIVLYGYDRKKKYETSLIEDFPITFFKVIDNMPMRKYDKSNLSQDKQLEFCGLSNGYPPTNHCFKDSTHQTCCLLGYKSREYADKSGNPIGKASIKAFKNFYGFYPKKNTLTPWCTCIGSEVCSYYSKRFNDGTHIKFINNYNKNRIITDNLNETLHRNKIGYYQHKTPGVE